MRNKAWFNLLFMLICTAFFTGILSSVYVGTRPLIASNARLTEIKAHLNAFAMAIPASSGVIEIESFYDQQIIEQDIKGARIYLYKDTSDTTVYYGIPFSGAGLWGTIEGIIALTADLKQVVGLDFIAQNETPGLGGRIEEEWFLEQFRGIQLYEEKPAIRYTTSGNEGQVDAITGATATSVAVINMVNDHIEEIRTQLGGEQ